MTLKRVALILLVCGTLAGCTAVQPEATPTPTPTIDVGPLELSESEAGERFLGLVCQLNAAHDALGDAIVAGEPEWLNGGAPPVDAVNATAAETLRIGRMSVENMDDDYYVWPEEVAPQLEHVRQSIVLDLSTLSALANATRFEDAYYAQWPERSPEQVAASQEIRYQLGLDPDTTTSCEGYETALELLDEERLARIEYLNQFGK